MAKGRSNLATMGIEALIKLRDDIGAVLSEKASDLKKQLQWLETGDDEPSGRGRGRRGRPRCQAEVDAGAYQGRRQAGRLPDRTAGPDDPGPQEIRQARRTAEKGFLKNILEVDARPLTGSAGAAATALRRSAKACLFF